MTAALVSAGLLTHSRVRRRPKRTHILEKRGRPESVEDECANDWRSETSAYFISHPGHAGHVTAHFPLLL